MSPEEHTLMILMFAKQRRAIQTLADILRSRGVLEGDDLNAFNDLVSREEEVTLSMTRRVEAAYRIAAVSLGLDIGIEKP